MKKIVSVLLAALLLSPAFGQDNPITKYLSADASMVMSFNPVKISKKVPGETFRQSFMYQQMIAKEKSGDLKAFLENPFVTGIDFTQDLVMVMITDTAKEASGFSFNVYGVLKDESVFASFIKKMAKEQDGVRAYGTNKILSSEDGSSTMGWNNEVFVLVIANKKELQKELYGVYSDTTTQVSMEKKMEEIKFTRQKNQRNKCFELLTPKSQNPFYSNIAFTSVMNGPGDIKLWNNGRANPALLGKNPMAQIFSQQMQAFSGKNITSVISFENGKITGKSQYFMEGSMADLYKKYPSPALDIDLTRRIPKGTLLGLFLSSVNTGMAGEMIKRTGLSEMIEKAKEKIPFDLSLLKSVFKGNIMLAVVKTDDVDPNDKLKGIQFILAVPIGDKSKFDELRMTLSKTLDSLKGSDKGAKMFKDVKPVIKYNDNLLVLSLSEKTAMDFLNNPGTGNAPDWLQGSNGYSMTMSINMKGLLTTLLQKTSDKGSEKDMQMQKIFGMFDQMIIMGGNYENGSLNSSMEFRFSNHDDNALKQFFDMINMAMQQSEKAKMERQKEMKEEKNDAAKKVLKDEEVPLPPPPPSKPAKKTKN